jgi:cytochrome b561
MTNEITNKTSYTNLAIILHWLLACLLVFQLCVGVFMVDIPKGPDSPRAVWFNLHKSMGILIALLIVLRLIWRLKNPPPSLPKSILGWKRLVSNANHFLLYACMIVMPVSGIIGSVFSKYPIKFFGTLIPRLAEHDQIIKSLASDLHQYFSFAFIFFISVHVLAAMKHLLIDCDGVFERIMMKQK